MQIIDVSPARAGTTITLPGWLQSTSGKALCISTSTSGQRVYLGGHSGVWRSDDGGANWRHLTQNQPPPGQIDVPGALLIPNVYDLLVSPEDDDLVFAATGRDPRRPAQNGVYRSSNGGHTWSLVHQFTSLQNGAARVRSVGRLAVAPDNAQLIYAAGESAVGISQDGGLTWDETFPQTFSSQRVRHVVTGPQEGAIRRVYAIGHRVWYSEDGGQSWQQDPFGLWLAFPSDSVGTSSRALTIHPDNSAIIYVNANQRLFRGDFTDAGTSGAAVWRELPSIPIGFPNTTASGTDYLIAHMTPQGQLLLFASDRRTTHVCVGEPTTSSDWIRIDGDPVHVDPHGLALTPDFRLPPPGGPVGTLGRIYMVNDGGADWSTDGAASWQKGQGLSTLGLVNAAVLPRPGGIPSICIGMGDNSGFFSPDGGETWRTQEYVGGDNDACFADPRQPNRLIVFAPRTGLQGIFLYTAAPGDVPDGAIGTSDRTAIPGPPPRSSGETRPGWNATSAPYNLGYRPLVYTLADETPRPDGDFVVIRYSGTRAFLVRTTAMTSIVSSSDWEPTATSEGPGVKVFQPGPDLPSQDIRVVQASGGHSAPSFYVADTDAGRLWKWSPGMLSWQQLVPTASPAPVAPSVVRRFFVSPYDPDVVYVLSDDHVVRSDDGGGHWIVDLGLESVLTENGAFPFNIPPDGNPGQALVRDIWFDPERPGYRFAVGPAGVFYTLDGLHWDHLLRTSAQPMRPVNAFYDPVSDPCGRALYVSTSNRGLLRIAPLPPEWDHPMGAIVATTGKVELLRVHDVGTRFGPPSDVLDAEVIITLDTEPFKAFGFQLRPGDDEIARRGMLNELRDAFNRDSPVRIEYVRTGCRSGTIIRVIRLV